MRCGVVDLWVVGGLDGVYLGAPRVDVDDWTSALQAKVLVPFIKDAMKGKKALCWSSSQKCPQIPIRRGFRLARRRSAIRANEPKSFDFESRCASAARCAINRGRVDVGDEQAAPTLTQ